MHKRHLHWKRLRNQPSKHITPNRQNKKPNHRRHKKNNKQRHPQPPRHPRRRRQNKMRTPLTKNTTQRTTTMALEINNLHVNVNTTTILNGVNLTIEPGTVHALMGPNGSGKSTLAHTLMGHPKYIITQGQLLLDDKDITKAKPDERAKKGLFLSFQYPAEITGVKISNFLRTAYNATHEKKLSVVEFHTLLKEKMTILGMPPDMIKRSLNEGFSGGEKKRTEILQLMILQPKYAILDETDSGLDVDALKLVAEGINKARTKNMGILIITHYNKILDYIQPDKVHIMKNGKIIQSEGPELAKTIELQGYA